MIRPVYREEPCRSALNPVKGMPFKWSLNPYMGCAHRCTYCYVRGYERRADRPSGEDYGQSVRVKTNVAEVLRQELARRTWCGEGIAPVLPGIPDKPELLADVVRAAREAGATGVWCNVLFLAPGTREHFLEHLARDWPELLPRYERLYCATTYLPRSETEPIKRQVVALRERYGVTDRRQVKLEPAAKPEQLSLAV